MRPSAPTPTPLLRFVLVDDARRHPKTPQDFIGYYNGRAVVLECADAPSLVGRTFPITAHTMPSASPCYIYETQAVDASGLRLELPKTAVIRAIRPVDRLGPHELAYMCRELREPAPGEPPRRAPPSRVTSVYAEIGGGARAPTEDGAPPLTLALLGLPQRPSPADLCRLPPAVVERLKAHSDMARLPNAQMIMTYMGITSDDQWTALRALSWDQLEHACTILRTQPWTLAFRSVVRAEFGRLSPLTWDGFKRACRDFSIVIPIHVGYALKLYYAVLQDVELHKHTLFSWSTYAPHVIPMGPERGALNASVRAFLAQHAFVWLSGGPSDVTSPALFALKHHHADAVGVGKALSECIVRASRVPATLRSREDGVPEVPPLLDEEEGPQGGVTQKSVARHILGHAVTCLEGLPGTGKTVVITWLMSHFSAVLLCTLTGMMTKSLQKRNGARRESAHTIHSLVYAAERVVGGREWLARFEVLVIDEFSNTDMHLLAKLLRWLPSLVRIVFVGDHQQIRSIKEGDPLGDLGSFFGSHVLTKLLRVPAHLADLCYAPKLMAEEKHAQIRFTPGGPLSLVPKQLPEVHFSREQVELTLRPLARFIIARDRSLMAHHIVVLQHSVRDAINNVWQTLMGELGVLPRVPPPDAVKMGRHTFYVGCKITFSRNYNRPIKYTVDAVGGGKRNRSKDGPPPRVFESDPVSNGELSIIRSIEMLPDGQGIHLTISDSDDPDDAIIKRVLCSPTIEGAVQFIHIDLGYASTADKVQGKEFTHVIFWNNSNPALWCTRSRAYVAISRGKERVWVVSSREDFAQICNNVDRPRRTVLAHMLRAEGAFPSPLPPAISAGADVTDPSTLVRMTPGKACVPTLEEAVAVATRVAEEEGRKRLAVSE